MTEQQKWMEAVYANGFAADEARLFLDTHPDDAAALEYYNKKMELYQRAVANYEQHCGPISPHSAGRDGWKWAKCPWPWEGGM